MAVIAVDMDDVMADTLAKILKVYNERYNGTMTRENLNERYLKEVLLGENVSKVRSLVQEPGFFGDIAVMPGAPECLEKLSKKHKIFIASAAMDYPTSFTCKFEWLVRHFPFISPRNFVFCGDKSIIHADYLIDDQPRFLHAFTGQGILFDTPHNVQETGYPRVRNWAEVDAYFEAL